MCSYFLGKEDVGLERLALQAFVVKNLVVVGSSSSLTVGWGAGRSGGWDSSVTTATGRQRSNCARNCSRTGD